MNNEMIIYKYINYLKTFHLLNISYLMGIGKLAFLKKKKNLIEKHRGYKYNTIQLLYHSALKYL